MVKRALFSLYDIRHAENFAAKLIKCGWQIIASRETVELLRRAGLPVTDVAEFTGVREDYGFPPTLHPKIESYLTGSDLQRRIDLVYVINYPLSTGNDVGGRTLLALAAKGRRIPVNNLDDMRRVTGQIAKKGSVDKKFHMELINKTNAAIGAHFSSLLSFGKGASDVIRGTDPELLANGENPYQVPAEMFRIESTDKLSLPEFKQVSQNPPCFTNLADADSILQTLSLCAQGFKKHYNKIPYICVAAKHGNPCGLAIDWDNPKAAVDKALFANPRAVWGGETAVNFALDAGLAQAFLKSQKRKRLLGEASWMLDVVMAPQFSREAVDILKKREHRRLLQNSALSKPFLTTAKFNYRFVRGGFLRQPPANYVLDLADAEIAGRLPDKKTIDALIVAWACAYSSNHGGNEVALAKDRALIACAGGPSTVEAAQLVVYKAGYLKLKTQGAAFCADAFFPFTDAPRILAKAGVTAGVVPSGGKQFDAVKKYFKTTGIKMFFLKEQYRGFCRH